MSYDTDKDLTWFLRGLPARGVNKGRELKRSIPHAVSSSIVPGVDALGWTRMSEWAVEVASGVNVSAIGSADVPSGFVWYIPFAQVRHDDGVGNHTLWITCNEFTLPSTTALIPGLSVASGVPNAIQRPVVLRDNSELQGRSADAVGAGNTLFIEFLRIEIPIGEYIPPV